MLRGRQTTSQKADPLPQKQSTRERYVLYWNAHYFWLGVCCNRTRCKEIPRNINTTRYDPRLRNNIRKWYFLNKYFFGVVTICRLQIKRPRNFFFFSFKFSPANLGPMRHFHNSWQPCPRNPVSSTGFKRGNSESRTFHSIISSYSHVYFMSQYLLENSHGIHDSTFNHLVPSPTPIFNKHR